VRLRFTLNQQWVFVLAIILAMVIGWNYWLPMAEDLYNLVTPADENRQYPLRNVDFFAYYNAGTRFEKDDNPYFYGYPELGDFSDYIYPPTMLPAFGLLSRMAYDQARLFWLGLNMFSYLFCFCFLLVAVRREILQTFFTSGLLLTIASFPLLMHIHNGQSDVLIISIMLLGYLAYIKRFKSLSACLFALATLIKVSPVLFLIFFVVFLRDYRFLLYFFLWSIGLMLVSMLVVPFQLYLNYFFQVLPEVGKGTSNWLNQSIVKFFPSSQGFLAQTISLAGLGLFGWFAWWLGRRYPKDQRDPSGTLGEVHTISEAVFFLNMLIILIFAGKAWSMTYVWVILPSALLVARLLESQPQSWFLAIVGFGIFLMLSKVYGYPGLDSLNLWGSLILSTVLIIGLAKIDKNARPNINQPSPRRL